MSVTVKGAKNFMRKLIRAPKQITKNSAKALNTYGKKMVERARQDHDFVSRSGNLERAIQYKVDTSNLTMQFFINPTLVTSGKYNYGAIQHDGSYSNWNKSKFTPKSFSSKGGNGGVEYDHFMVRANDAYQSQLQDELHSIVWRALNGLS